MFAIFKRELDSFFSGLMGYIYCAFILVFNGIYVMVFNLNQMYSNYEYSLSYLSFLLIIAIPLLTMRVYSEERRQKTDQLLYSLPVSMGEIAVAKFLAVATVILVPCIVMSFYPLLLSTLGTVNFKGAYSTLFAFFCLSLALASIGLLISSVCENQVVAAGSCFILLIMLYYSADFSNYITASTKGTLLIFGVVMLAVGLVAGIASGDFKLGFITAASGEIICIICSVIWKNAFSQAIVKLLEKISLFTLFYNFVDGIFDLQIIVFYLSLTALMVFFTAIVLDNRRIRG